MAGKAARVAIERSGTCRDTRRVNCYRRTRFPKPDDAEPARYFIGVFAARYALLQASAIPIQAIGLLAGQLLR